MGEGVTIKNLKDLLVSTGLFQAVWIVLLDSRQVYLSAWR